MTRLRVETEQLVIVKVVVVLIVGLSLSGDEGSVGRDLLENDPSDEVLNDAVQTAISLLRETAVES